MTATTHGTAPGIYHEADQEAEGKGQARNHINWFLRLVGHKCNISGTDVKSVDHEPPCSQSNTSLQAASIIVFIPLEILLASQASKEEGIEQNSF